MAILEDIDDRKRQRAAISFTVVIFAVLGCALAWLEAHPSLDKPDSVPGHTMARLWTGIGPGFSGPAISPEPDQEVFKVPNGWVKATETEFVLKEPEQELRRVEAMMASGSQPWRLEPKNAAAACLWDFGFRRGSTVLDLAPTLIPVQSRNAFKLKSGSSNYVVDIMIQRDLPIAYRLSLSK